MFRVMTYTVRPMTPHAWLKYIIIRFAPFHYVGTKKIPRNFLRNSISADRLLRYMHKLWDRVENKDKKRLPNDLSFVFDR